MATWWRSCGAEKLSNTLRSFTRKSTVCAVLSRAVIDSSATIRSASSWPADRHRSLTIDPSLVYSTYLGGSSTDVGFGIAVDSSGNAYVTGYTQSSNFPTTAGALQTTFGGLADAFVSKLNSSGSALVYSTYLGGGSTDFGFGIAVDSSGGAYVTGYTQSSNFPATAGALQTTFGGGADAFVSKLNSGGSALVYSTYLGGSSFDFGFGIAVDSSGNAYVTGYTCSSNFPTTAGALQTTFGVGGAIDAFVAKFRTAPPTITITSPTNTT